MHIEKLEHIFREYDIRGIMDEEIDEDFVHALGVILAEFYRQQKHNRVLLGYDTRKNSKYYHDILANEFSQNGLHVISLGLIPTPCLYFAVHQLGIPAGVMVTASHNPAKYNGFKLWNGKTTLSGQEITGLYRRMQEYLQNNSNQNHSKSSTKHSLKTPHKKGLISAHNIMLSYKEKVSENISPLNCSVLIDGANGAAGKICADIFRHNGAEVQELFCDYQEDFPNHEPDPTKSKNLQELLKQMQKNNSKYGIGLDGDGDRVVLTDKNGRILKSDELMSIFIHDIAKRKKNPHFLLDVKCSQRLVNEIHKLNATYEFMPTGHSLLKKGMLTTGADFGGEFSGHFFHSENWYKTDDGILTALRVINILERDKLDLTILPQWEKNVSGEEIGIPCTKEQKKNINQKIIAYFTQKYASKAKCISIDGIRCIFFDCWFLVRASQTSEQIILRFEAKNQKKYQSLKKSVLADLGKILQA